MEEQLPFPRTRVRRIRGTVETANERTVAAWRKGGDLVGPEHAAARAALRVAAQALDVAADALTGDARPYAVGIASSAARTYVDLLTLVGPHEGTGDDALEAWLDGIGAATRVPDSADS